MTAIKLLIEFVARHSDLFCVDDDDIAAHVHRRTVARLVFPSACKAWLLFLHKRQQAAGMYCTHIPFYAHYTFERHIVRFTVDQDTVMHLSGGHLSQQRTEHQHDILQRLT